MATKKTSVKKNTKKAPAAKRVTKKAPATKKTAKKAPAAKKKVTKKAPATKKTAKNAPAAKKKVTKKAPSSKKTAPGAASQAAPSGTSMVGKAAPAFRLQDQSGQIVSSASLKGKPYVLYFYPKDNTPGCTTESCEFRDEDRNFRRAGVTILGVSPDSVKSHAGFAGKYNLPFSLLSDPDKVLSKAYGAWDLKKNYGREYWGIVRSTFLVNAAGKVEKEWRKVRVAGHVGAVLEEAAS